MEQQPIITGEDSEYIYATAYLMGHPIRARRDKSNGEIFYNLDDLTRAYGAGGKTFEKFLGTDAGLDTINKWNRDHPGRSFFGDAIRKV